MWVHGRIIIRVFNKVFFKYPGFFDVSGRKAGVMEWRSEDVSLQWLLVAAIGYR
jgi:hypothetical protein